ncbi:MAG: CheR family methyltransferase [Aquabacterium sp.]
MTALLSPALDANATVPLELALAAEDFTRVQQLIRERAGIHLQDGKQAMVHSRLARRVRETGHAGFGSYLRWLTQASGPDADAEWQRFVNCLTTNLTSFFREEHHFTALADDLRQRRGRPLRIWCNAASTGEEPYSLAMTVLETLGTGAPVRILATDIDTQVLATAEAGVYAADARGLDAARLRQHFLRGKGAHEGRIRVKRDVAGLIRFDSFNLMREHWALGEPFDIVFCRNVMIYFDAATQRRVLQRIHGVMAPDGLLYVGHSENFTDARQWFRLRGKTIYERV